MPWGDMRDLTNRFVSEAPGKGPKRTFAGATLH